MNVDQNILEILERSALDGAILRLPDSQLDRATYTAVNKVIEAAGGKWNKKARAHVFDGLAVDTIEPILLTGEYRLVKQDFGQFDSPAPIANRVVQLAGIRGPVATLEPSCGVGNIVNAAETYGALVTGYEVDAKRLHAAKDRCVFYGGIHLTDFLTVKPVPVFDRVVMNPPFAKLADVAHVTHAAKFLKPDGRLVSVMSAMAACRTDNKSKAFRDFINSKGAEIETLPGGAFKESGTMVNAVIVSFDN